MTWQNLNDDTVTRAELYKELNKRMTTQLPVTFADYFSLATLIDNTVNKILQERNTVPVKITEKAEKDATLTLGELDAALNRMGIMGWASAGNIYKSVVEHREPEWNPGDVVRDAAGIVYLRTSSGKWHTFGNPATYGNDHPARPLKKFDT